MGWLWVWLVQPLQTKGLGSKLYCEMMKGLIFLLVLLGCCLFLLSARSSSEQLGEDFHPDRTLLIDVYPRTAKPTNFLFRGNMPVINGSFAYKEIVASMAKVAQAKNLTFPSNFSLIDVSYLNPFEFSDLEIERKYFESNPSIGKFYNKLITGTLIKPPQDDPGLIKDTVKEYIEVSHDQLPKLMQFFRGLLTAGSGPFVIFSHCEAGTDRTGEVSGAYYLKFLNMTFSDALSIDNHVQSRDMFTTSRNSLQWYCFYLKFVENFSYLNCTVPASY